MSKLDRKRFTPRTQRLQRLKKLERRLQRDWRKDHPNIVVKPQTHSHLGEAELFVMASKDFDAESLVSQAALRWLAVRDTVDTAKAEEIGMKTPAQATDKLVWEELVPGFPDDNFEIKHLTEVSRGIAIARQALKATLKHSS